jgi:hypothetical protein
MGALPRDLNASKTNDRPAPPRICSRATVAGGTIEGTPAALLSQSVGAADCGDRRAAFGSGDQRNPGRSLRWLGRFGLQQGAEGVDGKLSPEADRGRAPEPPKWADAFKARPKRQTEERRQ